MRLQPLEFKVPGHLRPAAGPGDPDRQVIHDPARPGRVLDDLPVRIPRPRRWAEMPRDLEFQRLLTHVLSLIRKQGD